MKIHVALIAVAVSVQMLVPFYALAAGVGQTCGGFIGIGCNRGLFCETAGKCVLAGGQGKCVQPPAACNKMSRPVCGCDSKTYANDCERQAARVSKSHDGKCS